MKEQERKNGRKEDKEGKFVPWCLDWEALPEMQGMTLRQATPSLTCTMILHRLLGESELHISATSVDSSCSSSGAHQQTG